MEEIRCPACGKPVPEKAEKCPECGATVETEIVCPKCGGRNVVPISGLSKAATIAQWGIFSIKKAKATHRCTDCGQRF